MSFYCCIFYYLYSIIKIKNKSVFTVYKFNYLDLEYFPIIASVYETFPDRMIGKTYKLKFK